MKQIEIKLTGLAPLIQHNIRLANPLDPVTREMKRFTAKKSNMTDEERRIVQKLEWFGGLYTNAEEETVGDGDVRVEASARVILPAVNLEALIVEGAKKQRKGKQAKAAVFIEQDPLLDYSGPKEVNDLYGTGRHSLVVGVRNRQSRIMRTRPIFREWSVSFAVTYDDRSIDKGQIVEALEAAGRQVGVGDWRPKFGRFQVEAA